MPNRIIKESICTSENIEKLTDEEEVFFYRLLVNCDDYGRMDGRPEIIRAKCYPLRLDKVKAKDIEKWVTKLRREDLIICYIVENRPYIQMATWEKHQQIRAKRSKFPSLDSDDVIVITDDIICNQELSNAPVIQSNPIQSESNPNPNPIYVEMFEDFWKVYPRKKEKANALKRWNILMKEGVMPDELIRAGKNYAKECTDEKKEQKFIKHAATFLGPNKPYQDYLEEVKPDGILGDDGKSSCESDFESAFFGR